MNEPDLRRLLEQVASGRLSPAAAQERLLPYSDLGFAKLDVHRDARTGVPEAVYGEGKSAEQLCHIARHLVERSGRALVTRLDETRASTLQREVPGGTWHPDARIWCVGDAEPVADAGRIAVLAAGTSDLAVAEEAAVTATWLGLEVDRNFDVGIAGLHRLLDRLEVVREAAVVIAVAGMDGALPTAVAGLVRAPVIAVPTSVGYGASFSGIAALLTMLNGCAPGIAVVNIDNGYGAGAMAYRIVAGTREPLRAPCEFR